MDALIAVTTNDLNEQLVSARELHKALDIKTRFSLWASQNFKNFKEGIDFSPVVGTTQQNQHGGSQKVEDYAMLIDMAKHIAMMSGTDKGSEVREYFIQVEKEFREQFRLPSDPMDILALTFKAQKNTNLRVGKIETDIRDLKDLKKLEPGEYNYLGTAVSNKIFSVLEELALNKKTQAPLRKELSKNINELAGVRTRTQIKQKDFDKLLDFIDRWQPSTITVDKAKEIQLKLDLDEEGAK